MLISVIIPAYNEEDNIAKCLASIKSQEYVDADIEIILVDNGSTDNTVMVAERFNIDIYIKENVNVSEMRNYGANKAKGEIFAFIDADCIASPDWISNAIFTMNKYCADAVGSFHDIPENYGWVSKISELIQGKKRGTNINYIPSGNFIVKKIAFNSANGFDNKLETNEDVDICYRLRNLGKKILIDSSIKCIHLGSPKNALEMFQREIWHGKSSWDLFIRKNKKKYKIVVYSFINLIAIINIIFSLFYLLLVGSIVPFIYAITFYAIINFFIIANDWRKTKYISLQLIIYDVIYGIARSLSFFSWIFSYNRKRYGK